MTRISIAANEEVCLNCVHYLQHYVMTKTAFVACNEGHCITPRTKSRKPSHEACYHFEQRDDKVISIIHIPSHE